MDYGDRRFQKEYFKLTKINWSRYCRYIYVIGQSLRCRMACVIWFSPGVGIAKVIRHTVLHEKENRIDLFC